MSKLSLILPAMALVVALSGSALAENGIVSQAALNDMGLAGIEVMSDEAAMEIRGQGFLVKKSASIAFGASLAYVGAPNAGAGSIDGYLADGKYMASGEHLSEAVLTRSVTKKLVVKGDTELRIRTTTLSVAAGGRAMSSSL